jgi:hypothetical protein
LGSAALLFVPLSVGEAGLDGFAFGGVVVGLVVVGFGLEDAGFCAKEGFTTKKEKFRQQAINPLIKMV